MFGFFDLLAAPHLCRNSDPCPLSPWVPGFTLFCSAHLCVVLASGRMLSPRGPPLRQASSTRCVTTCWAARPEAALLIPHLAPESHVLFGSRGDLLLFIPSVNPASPCWLPGNLHRFPHWWVLQTTATLSPGTSSNSFLECLK